MKPTQACRPENLHYLKMLARQYPTVQAASTEIINLQAILNLPFAGRMSSLRRNCARPGPVMSCLPPPPPRRSGTSWPP